MVGRPAVPGHRLHLLRAWGRYGDHVCIWPQVVARIFEHEAETPTFISFECLAELAPCQTAAVNNDVERPTVPTTAAPDESACDVIVS